MNYTLDTNIITALMKNDARVKKKLQDAVLHGERVLINGMSYYETKRGLLAVNATTKLRIFDEFCKRFGVLFLDSKGIFDEASRIYVDLKRRGELIEDADILIAAIALAQNLIVVSDDPHFLRIKGVNVENWLEV